MVGFVLRCCKVKIIVWSGIALRNPSTADTTSEPWRLTRATNATATDSICTTRHGRSRLERAQASEKASECGHKSAKEQIAKDCDLTDPWKDQRCVADSTRRVHLRCSSLHMITGRQV